MVFIDSTVVNVALPALQASLNASVVDVQWVVEAYSLLLSALLLLGGSLGDHYGRRRVFGFGVILFSLASAWCGLAANIHQLILARAMQGAGGALLVPGSLAIISASFREEDRGRAIGTWSGFTAITAAIGPVIGGWLIEHISWRAVFFINLPLAAVVLLISIYRVPESRDESENARIDWLGAVLATTGLGSLVYGLIESSRLGFSHPAVVAALLGGSFLLIVFLMVEARTRNPMLPLSLFRSRDFAGSNLLTLFFLQRLGGTLFCRCYDSSASITRPRAALERRCPSIVFWIIFVLSRWSGGTGETLRSQQASAGCRSDHRGRRVRSVCRAGSWSRLLEQVFSGNSGSRFGNGRKRCATDHDRHERSAAQSRWGRIGN